MRLTVCISRDVRHIVSFLDELAAGSSLIKAPTLPTVGSIVFTNSSIHTPYPQRSLKYEVYDNNNTPRRMMIHTALKLMMTMELRVAPLLDTYVGVPVSSRAPSRRRDFLFKKFCHINFVASISFFHSQFCDYLESPQDLKFLCRYTRHSPTQMICGPPSLWYPERLSQENVHKGKPPRSPPQFVLPPHCSGPNTTRSKRKMIDKETCNKLSGL